MGIRYLCLFGLLIGSTSLVAQNQNTFSKAGLLEDLQFLNEVYVQGHSANYREGAARYTLQPLLDSVQAHLTDSLTGEQYFFLLRHAIALSGCVHTRLEKADALFLDKKTRFPMPFYWIGGQMLVAEQPDNPLPLQMGEPILEINGLPSSQALAPLLHLFPADGGGSTLSEWVIRRSGRYYLALALGHPEQYTVPLADPPLTFPAATKGANPAPPVRSFVPEVTFKADDESDFGYLQDSVAVLRLGGFHRRDMLRYRQVMKTLIEEEIPYLILDLRANGGGSRMACTQLMRYMATEPFEYTFVNPPQQKLFPYLNAKGKYYRSMAFLKFGLFNIHPVVSTPWGWGRRYRNRPAAKTFQGQITVLTDGLTASASAQLVSWLSQQQRALVVGRRPAGGYNGNNGGSFPLVTLPSSKVQVVIPAFRLVLQADSDQDQGITPHVPVQYTLEDYLNGQDADLRATLDYWGIDFSGLED